MSVEEKDDPSRATPLPLSQEQPPSNMRHRHRRDRRCSRCCRLRELLESEAYQTFYRRWVLLSLALLVVSLSSGLNYGWPALRARLIYETNGAFQEEQLGTMYTFGAWSTQGGRFFLGLARDRFGTRAIACFSLLVLVGGLSGVAASSLYLPNGGWNGGVEDDAAASAATGSTTTAALWVLSSSLFAIGLGSGGQLCFQPVAGLFPNHTGIVLSSLSGAFQVSGLVFLVLTSNRDQTRLWVSFAGFALCILVLVVLSAILLPGGNSFLLPSADAVEESSIDEETNGTGEREQPIEGKSRNQNSRVHELGEMDDGSNIPEDQQSHHGIDPNSGGSSSRSSNAVAASPAPTTAWEQIKTLEYTLLCAWFSISIVPMQYYVGIIGYQLEGLGDDRGLYTDLFSYLFAGAALTAPLAGHIADKHGLGIAQGMATLTVALPFLLLSVRDSLPLRAQVVGLTAYGIGRMGIFGLYFTNCGKRFGYSNYGTLAGLGLLVSAIVSLLQYPLIGWTVGGRSDLINALSAAILVIPTAPYFVWLHQKEQREKQNEEQKLEGQHHREQTC